MFNQGQMQMMLGGVPPGPAIIPNQGIPPQMQPMGQQPDKNDNSASDKEAGGTKRKKGSGEEKKNQNKTDKQREKEEKKREKEASEAAKKAQKEREK